MEMSINERKNKMENKLKNVIKSLTVWIREEKVVIEKGRMHFSDCNAYLEYNCDYARLSDDERKNLSNIIKGVK